MADFLRFPSIDRLIRHASRHDLSESIARMTVGDFERWVRETFAPNASEDDILDAWLSYCRDFQALSLRPCLNLSGVVLHTGLGRAALHPEAIEAVRNAGEYSNVELDLATGDRGDRQDHCRRWLQALTGAEDAVVVNNCAAAALLSIASLGAGHEVLLPASQMVEIGGSFRMPEIVKMSGCELVTVGCTNKFRIADLESALNLETLAVIQCSRSNFSLSGFVEEPAPEEIAGFCRQHDLFFLDDLGSGCLIDTAQVGLRHERTVQEAVATGADLVLFSGDKLLGGPQSGIVVGNRALIGKLKRHPFYRAFRPDKLTVAALEATLRLYGEGRWIEIPHWRCIARPQAEIEANAKRLLSQVQCGGDLTDGRTQIGGGSMPGQEVPTLVVSLNSQLNPTQLARRLRQSSPCIVGFIRDGRLGFDARQMEPDQIDIIASRINESVI